MSKPSGLDWGAVTAQYVANGGKVRPEVWRAPEPGKATSSRPGGAHRNRQPKGTPRGIPRALSDADERQLAERYAAGESSPALAVAYGFKSAATVRKIVRRQGGEVRSIKEAIAKSDRSPLTEEQAQEMYRRYEAGESAEAMAKEYKTTPRSARRAIVRQGGTIRSKSEATKLARNREKTT